MASTTTLTKTHPLCAASQCTPRYVIAYSVITIFVVLIQIFTLDAYICTHRSRVWMVVFFPLDLLVVVLFSLALKNSTKMPSFKIIEDWSQFFQELPHRNSNTVLTTTWTIYLFDVLFKMILLFVPARTLSVFHLLGPNTLINTVRLIPLVFFLLYTVVTHRAQEAQRFMVRHQQQTPERLVDHGELKQFIIDVALDLLDATELYHVFSYFSTSHGHKTEYAHLPFSFNLPSAVSVIPDTQLYSNSTNGFSPVHYPFQASVSSPIPLSDLFPSSDDVCRAISNVSEFKSEVISEFMLFFTALAGVVSIYAMLVYELHFFPIEPEQDDSMLGSSNYVALDNENLLQRPKRKPRRFHHYSQLSVYCVNLPAFVLRMLLWLSFRVDISPLIIKNVMFFLFFLQ